MNLKSISLYTTASILLLSNMMYGQNSDIPKEISLEDIWLKNTFAVASVPGFNVMKDGKRYVKIENGGDVNIYELKNNKPAGQLISARELIHNGDTIRMSSFAFSADEQKVLLFTDPEPIYRHSTLFSVYVYDIISKKIKSLDEEKVLHASFSPDASKIAYVKSNDLYVNDLHTNNTVAVTNDGKWNAIINGNCDWVYEEEFSFTKAYEWSSKGNYIAYYRFDESDVKEFTMFYDEGKDYPVQYTYKYPKAGEDNSVVSIHIYDVNQKKTVNADVGPEKDQYIPRIKWSNNDEQLSITRLNRHQNHLELLLADAKSGTTKVIYDERDQYYIDITDDLTFLPDGRSFVISSGRDGFNHLYQWNWVKQELKQLTKGEDEISSVLGVDIVNNKVYYTLIENVLNTGLYVYDLKTDKTKRLSNRSGTHSITAFPGFRYFLERYSHSAGVPEISLIDNNGKLVRMLEDNKKLKANLTKFDIKAPEFFKVPNDEGTELNAYMIKPVDFDPAKKYPVLMYQYSGPGSQQVTDRFPLDNYWWHQLLAQKGYIVVVADGTGTGGRGEAFKKKTYLQLGNLESNDQIAVAKYLGRQTYVDAARIGIWGWSYGGFMSTTCILKAPDVFKAAIAVAPVTNWRLYDNIYTERFMRTPAENPKGYDDNAPLSMAKDLKGKYLLIHGMADDNVHLQNATELSRALVDANKNFDAFYYTNKNHGIGGGYTRYNLYVKMTEFILKNL